MELTVTYVHHNCFCLTVGDRALLFDYPRERHRNPQAEDIVRRALTGKRAAIFFSHSHADHCSPDVSIPARAAASVHYVLSFDVPEMIPSLDPDQGLENGFVVEPGDAPGGGDVGEAVQVDDGLTVRALESNDLGVAFLIEVDGLRVYYGGDLALWLWPGMDPASEKFTRDYFTNSLEAVRIFAPHIAFTDCDKRLPDWGGFKDFAETVRPPVLVPTHDFGEPKTVAAYASGISAVDVNIITFGETGETATVSVK